jgi:hypothetical protein
MQAHELTKNQSQSICRPGSGLGVRFGLRVQPERAAKLGAKLVEISCFPVSKFWHKLLRTFKSKRKDMKSHCGIISKTPNA